MLINIAKVYLLSDRAIQVDWSGGSSSDVVTGKRCDAGSHLTHTTISPSQLAALRMHLVQELQSSAWPAFQCVQADLSLTFLFADTVLFQHDTQAMVEQVKKLVSNSMKDVSLRADSVTTATHASTNNHRVVVSYGGVAGQDLAWVAEQTGLSTDAVIDLHCSVSYTVQFLGFLPGFAYLEGLPGQLHLPRRESPRARVPAGTLAMGAHYCAVYPWESPGGWHLLGRVEQVLFDPENSDEQGHSLFKAGDTVQFIRANNA